MKKYILLSLVFVCVYTVSAQKVKKAYKNLEKLDYEKAYSEFRGILASESKNPAGNFGLALITGDKNSPKYDIVDAWDYASKTEKNLSRLSPEDELIIGEYFTNTETRRSSRKPRKKMEHAIAALEDKLITYVREENNLDIVYEVIERFPDFRHYDNVIHIRNQLEYRKYEKQNTLAGYLEFMNKFPDAAQINKAQKHIYELAFKQVKQTNTVDAYNAYISKYPKSAHVPMAIKYRNTTAFQAAKRINSIDAYEKYILKYPDALEIADAKIILRNLLYEHAKRVNTLEAYNNFITRYPDGMQYIDIFNLKSKELGRQFLLKNQFTGNFLWAHKYDNNSQLEYGGILTISPNRELIVACNTTSMEHLENSEVWVLKLSSVGKMIWNKTVGNKFEDYINCIETNQAGEVFGAGYTYVTGDSASQRGWIFKLGADGKKVWNRFLDMKEITSLAVTGTGEIIAAGYHLDDSLNYHYMITVLNNAGKRLWNRIYTGEGKINDLYVTAQNNIILAGNSWGFAIDPKGYLKWEVYFNPTDSITTVTDLSDGTVCFAGIEPAKGIILYAYQPNGKWKWGKSYGLDGEQASVKCLANDGKIISIAGEMIGLSVVVQFDALGNHLYTKQIPYSINLSMIANDKQNNLLLILNDSSDLIIVKNNTFRF